MTKKLDSLFNKIHSSVRVHSSNPRPSKDDALALEYKVRKIMQDFENDENTHEATITIGELLMWFKRYERYVQADSIDAEPWRHEFLEFVMYLVNNLDERGKNE